MPPRRGLFDCFCGFASGFTGLSGLSGWEGQEVGCRIDSVVMGEQGAPREHEGVWQGGSTNKVLRWSTGDGFCGCGIVPIGGNGLAKRWRIAAIHFKK